MGITEEVSAGYAMECKVHEVDVIRGDRSAVHIWSLFQPHRHVRILISVIFGGESSAS